MDIETSCLQKKPARIYQITWLMSRLHIGKSFILFTDHARTSNFTDFESFIDSQSHVQASVESVIIKVCHPTGVKTSTHLDNGLRNHSLPLQVVRQTSNPWAIKRNSQSVSDLFESWEIFTESADVTLCMLVE